MKNVYHLDLNKQKTQGAKIALLPGDPFRSQIIADTISRIYNTSNESWHGKESFVLI